MVWIWTAPPLTSLILLGYTTSFCDLQENPFQHSSFQIHVFPLELNGRTKTPYLYLGSDKNMGHCGTSREWVRHIRGSLESLATSRMTWKRFIYNLKYVHQLSFLSQCCETRSFVVAWPDLNSWAVPLP